jgi:hypothetical protein
MLLKLGWHLQVIIFIGSPVWIIIDWHVHRLFIYIFAIVVLNNELFALLNALRWEQYLLSFLFFELLFASEGHNLTWWQGGVKACTEWIRSTCSRILSLDISFVILPTYRGWVISLGSETVSNIFCGLSAASGRPRCFASAANSLGWYDELFMVELPLLRRHLLSNY